MSRPCVGRLAPHCLPPLIQPCRPRKGVAALHDKRAHCQNVSLLPSRNMSTPLPALALVTDHTARWPTSRRFCVLGGAAVVVAAMFIAHRQARPWRPAGPLPSLPLPG